MAKLDFGMMQSLDGYVDNMEFAPGPALLRHFIEDVHGLIGCVYGRRMQRTLLPTIAINAGRNHRNRGIAWRILAEVKHPSSEHDRGKYRYSHAKPRIGADTASRHGFEPIREQAQLLT